MAESSLKICGPCERDSEQKDAIHWCSTCREGLCQKCSKEHKKNRASANHKIVQLEHLSNLSDSLLSVNTLCEEHTNKDISFYCTSHSTLCCVTCIPSFHRNCEDVITIEDASKNAAQSGALDDLQTRIEDLTGIFDVILKKQDNNLNTLESQESKIDKEISERKKSIALELERAEKMARERLKNQRKICVADIMTMREQMVKKKSHLETIQRDLKTLKEHASDQHIFIAVKRLDASQNELEHEVQKKRKKMTYQYELKSSAMTKSLPKFDSLFVDVGIHKLSMDGVPELKKYNQCQIASQSMGKLTLKKEINIKEKTGENCGGMFKVCYFPVHDKAALTDTGSHSVYIYDMRSGNVQVVKLKENGTLWYITSFDDNNALLVIQGQKQLLKLNITDLTVKTEISFKSDGDRLWLVTCLNRHIITWNYGVKEFFIIKNGRVLKKIAEDQEVGYMCGYGKDKIIYTCYYNGSLHCVNLEGIAIFNLSRGDITSHIAAPLGVVVDRDNYIYIASQRGILRLTPAGQIDKTIDSSVSALGMAYKTSTHELICVDFKWLRIYKIE